MSDFGCLSKTRSPRTAFEAQLFVVLGLLKTLGFNHIQRQIREIGMRLSQSIHILDQTARHKSGRQKYRDHTLQGLACLCQTSSDIWKIFSILASILNYSVPSSRYI